MFSVIVPAYRAADLLPDSLAALVASDLAREHWELIVVDDAGGDNTGEIAKRWADRVIILDGPPGGPGRGRNAGAAIARGSWLVFVDQDVRVHHDTLARIAANVERFPDLVAMFGTYDAHPAARGVLSEYRNLLHRKVHCAGAGNAETFWAGCGAVRREAFEAVSGFDTVRFPRGQIEDIDLGYRLRDAGGRILLDPGIQGTHLKRWTFSGMLRTDIRDRGIPWMRLLLERGGRQAAALNTGYAEQLKVALAAGTATAFVAGWRTANRQLVIVAFGIDAGARRKQPADVRMVRRTTRVAIRAAGRPPQSAVLPRQRRRGGGLARGSTSTTPEAAGPATPARAPRECVTSRGWRDDGPQDLCAGILRPDARPRRRIMVECRDARHRRAVARSAPRLPASGAMLDVGCGSGQTITWFARHWPGWHVAGLDVSPDGLRAAHAGTGQPVFGASAVDLPMPDSTVDAIITLDVLQHLPLDGGDTQALAEMRRVLKPGGVLMIRTNAQSWPRTSDDPQYNFHKYSTRELRGKLDAAGFDVHRLGSLNALLGLAEIPRELRVRRIAGTGYVGLLGPGSSARSALARQACMASIRGCLGRGRDVASPGPRHTGAGSRTRER